MEEWLLSASLGHKPAGTLERASRARAPILHHDPRQEPEGLPASTDELSHPGDLRSSAGRDTKVVFDGAF